MELPAAPGEEVQTRAEIVRRAAGRGGIELAEGAAVERVGEAQRERDTPLLPAEAAEAAEPQASPLHTQDEFTAFLSDIAATVEEIVETAPWRKRLAEAILRWEGEGIRTRRLEGALDADTAPDVDGLLAAFAADVGKLRAVRDELEALRADSARSPVLADPDRVAEAEALLLSARAAAERRAEEAARALPQVDRWYFSREKAALDWLALDDRLIEELG